MKIKFKDNVLPYLGPFALAFAFFISLHVFVLNPLVKIAFSNLHLQSPEQGKLSYRQLNSMNQTCWYRSVGDWRPGTIRHWVTSDAVAVVEDEETGYCHAVDLDNINFRELKPW